MSSLLSNNYSIISKLKEIQLKHGYTNLQMAEMLNCSSQLYRDTKAERLPIGLKIIKGTLKAFPETAKDVLFFLTDGADISTQLAVICTEATQTHQNENLSILRRLLNIFLKLNKNKGF